MNNAVQRCSCFVIAADDGGALSRPPVRTTPKVKRTPPRSVFRINHVSPTAGNGFSSEREATGQADHDSTGNNCSALWPTGWQASCLASSKANRTSREKEYLFASTHRHRRLVRSVTRALCQRLLRRRRGLRQRLRRCVFPSPSQKKFRQSQHRPAFSFLDDSLPVSNEPRRNRVNDSVTFGRGA